VINRLALKRMWLMLDRRARRRALAVMLMTVLSAVASAGMVASVFPFLAVLSEPATIERNPALSAFRSLLGIESAFDFAVALGAVSIAVTILANALLVANTYALVRFSQGQIYMLSRRLLAHHLARPYVASLDRHSGDVATGVLAEAQQAVTEFLRPFIELVVSTTTVAAVIGAVIAIEPVIGLIVCVSIGGFFGLVLWLSRKRLSRYGHARMEANRARFRITTEALGAVKEIKLLGLERAYLRRFEAPARRMATIATRIELIATAPRLVLQAAVFVGIIALCLILLDPAGFATGSALGGILPVLGVLAFGAQRAMPEINRLFSALARMRSGAAAVDRAWADLGPDAETPRLPPDDAAGLGLRDRLDLRNVTFAYPNAAQTGLRDLSLTIRAGERIGIVGPTGAGKTTLADVLLGLLTPDTGRFLVDGTEITAETMRAWQRSVGYVPQDIFLTDASVAENIALGLRPDEIDQARVEECARLARLHDFVVGELPQGYATKTGERGVRLSGGQRQRIGIARALYHDADLIVLDEATSALDTVTERAVMDAIEGLPGDKTLLMIAHRLSTLRRCDRIVMLEQGRLVAEGSWERLIQTCPRFRDFASHAATERQEAAG